MTDAKEYEDPKDARAALHELNGTRLNGERIVVEFSRKYCVFSRP